MKTIKKPKQTEFIERQGYGYKDLPKLDFEEEEIIQQFDENHKRNKAVVKEILEYYPLARENDLVLYIELLRCLDLCTVTSGKDNFVFKIPRDKVKFVPSSESISRARRSLNAKGIGLPNNPIIIQRRLKRQKALQKYFRENT